LQKVTKQHAAAITQLSALQKQHEQLKLHLAEQEAETAAAGMRVEVAKQEVASIAERELKEKALKSSLVAEFLPGSRELAYLDTSPENIGEVTGRVTWYRCLRDVKVTDDVIIDALSDDAELKNLKQGEFVEVLEEMSDLGITRGPHRQDG
jgi:hypothetical protein